MSADCNHIIEVSTFQAITKFPGSVNYFEKTEMPKVLKKNQYHGWRQLGGLVAF